MNLLIKLIIGIIGFLFTIDGILVFTSTKYFNWWNHKFINSRNERDYASNKFVLGFRSLIFGLGMIFAVIYYSNI